MYCARSEVVLADDIIIVDWSFEISSHLFQPSTPGESARMHFSRYEPQWRVCISVSASRFALPRLASLYTCELHQWVYLISSNSTSADSYPLLKNNLSTVATLASYSYKYAVEADGDAPRWAGDGGGWRLLSCTQRSAFCQDLLLSLIHISEPTRQAEISYAVFCLKKKI